MSQDLERFAGLGKMSQDTKLTVATKAFIKFEKKILILKESKRYDDGTNDGKFDVPGGRVEPGQNFKESLLREIKEETGLNVEVKNPFFVGEWRPIIKEVPWQIVGIFFECIAKDSQVTLSQDHESYLWIEPKEYEKYNLIKNLNGAFEEYIKS